MGPGHRRGGASSRGRKGLAISTTAKAAMRAVFSSPWLVAAACCCGATVAGVGGDPAGLPLGGPL